MSDALRERVARAIYFVYCEDTSPVVDRPSVQAATAAIALVRAEALEEAARECDRREDELARQWRNGLKADTHLEGQSDGAGDCAAAIRALKEKP